MVFSLRYRDVKAACAKAIGECEDNARVIDYVNRATERLLYDGKWKGTVQTLRICVDSSRCIVWPREIETIEAISLCSTPVPLRSVWYEFNENGPGEIGENSCLSGLIDREEVCAFDQVVGEDKKLAVYAERTEETGKYVNLQFYNDSGQWVRTEFDGQIIDGENVAIPSTPGTYNYTQNKCLAGGLVRASKAVTDGIVRLYEYNTLTTEIRPLAYYQPDEEVPVYRRSLIPDLDVNSCEQTQVNVRGKLRFIPVRTDESYVLISHREALRLACHAIQKEENDLYDEAAANWNIAYRLLNAQLAHYKGDGERPAPQFASRTIWGGQPVMNPL